MRHRDCDISREIFDSGLSLTPQIKAFYQFHVYFTIRRVLYQLGGIQNISALPGHPTFNKFNNHYDVASFNRICAEFGVDPSSNFRFTHGKNNGLGNIYTYVRGVHKTGAAYPGFDKFSDEGGKAKDGNVIYDIEPDASTQYDWFARKTAVGLTKAGLSRINQSIEAFVYCGGLMVSALDSGASGPGSSPGRGQWDSVLCSWARIDNKWRFIHVC